MDGEVERQKTSTVPNARRWNRMLGTDPFASCRRGNIQRLHISCTKDSIHVPVLTVSAFIVAQNEIGACQQRTSEFNFGTKSRAKRVFVTSCISSVPGCEITKTLLLRFGRFHLILFLFLARMKVRQGHVRLTPSRLDGALFSSPLCGLRHDTTHALFVRKGGSSFAAAW